MSKKQYERVRNRTISFRTTEEEYQAINIKLALINKPKGEVIRDLLAYGSVNVTMGKFQIEKLVLEIKKMRLNIQDIIDNNDFLSQEKLLLELKVMLREVIHLLQEK